MNTFLHKTPSYLLVLILLVLGITSACGKTISTPSPIETAAATGTASLRIPTSTSSPTATHLPSERTSTSSPTSSPWLSSPLEGISISELPAILSNPLRLSTPLLETDHHGVDFSFWSYKSWKKMEGLGVQAVIGGTVAVVIHNRYPYGNMVMIETLMDNLPQDLPLTLKLPSLVPTLDLSQNPLTCPTAVGPTFVIGEKRSLYLVYAHLSKDPSLKPGDRIICGQKIGEVGNSGDSSNPHLHLEARVGPANARFSSMAHYVNDSTDEERYNYCTWRISGLFQIFDPMKLLASGNQ